MNDLTRREFINTAAVAAVGGAIIGPTAFLNATTAGAPFARTHSSAVNYVGPITPIDSVIFPKPQEISSSDDNLILDNQVTIVVPLNASEQDLFLARSLEAVMTFG